MDPKKMPVLFVSHGAPSFFVESTSEGIMSEFSKGSPNYNSILRLPKQINAEHPAAIVMITAHWEGKKVQISAKDPPSLYYDYRGFHPSCSSISYHIPSLPLLSRRIYSLLENKGIDSELDFSRGLDHGAFIPPVLMFPDGNIPIVAISILKSLDPKEHIEIGKALAPLREEGVLIIGSGSTIHETINGEENKYFVDEIDRIITEASPAEREKTMVDWTKIRGANYAHRRADHILPLHVVIGAAGNDSGKLAFRRDAFNGRVIYSNYYFD